MNMFKFRTQKNWKIGFWVLLIACSLSVINCNLPNAFTQDSKEEEAFFVAKKAFEDRFYDVSIELLERFLKTYPQSAKAQEVNLLIGRCLFYQNKFLDALAKFDALLGDTSAKKIKDGVLYWTAEVHFKGNNFAKAATYYKLLIEEFPNSSYIAAAYYSLGWCLFQEQNFSDALIDFKLVEERYPKDPQAKDASFKIIECLYNLKDYSGLKERIRPLLKGYLKDNASLAYLYFYLAEADYYLNNFNEALGEYSSVLANAGEGDLTALSKLGLAWTNLKLKKYKEAEGIFQEIAIGSLTKRSLDALLLGKAILMAQTNRIDEAKKIYDELLTATDEPSVLIQAYLGKAEALYNLAEYPQAVKVYKEALDKAALFSSCGELVDKLHYSLAWVFLKQGEFKEAIKEFQKIVKTSDDNIVKVSALCQIGDAYQDSGDYAKAGEAYDTILKDYPDSFYGDYVQYQLGLTMLKKSNYDAAILSFLSLKRNYPDSKLLDEVSYALGLAYFQKQDYNASKEIFARFQDEFKESNLGPQALYLLGSSLYNLGDYNAAIEVFKNIIRLYGQDVELSQKAEYEIADCFYQMGREKEAMSRFTALRSKYPDSSLTPEIMWWLAGYYYRQNAASLTRRYLSSLIQDFPKSNLVADAYYALGSSFQEEANYKEALQNFQKVKELSKTDLAGQATIAMADIYIKQEQFNSAIQTYQEIIHDYPNLTNLVYPKMAELYFEIGNYPEALNFYRKSLETVPVKDMAGIQLKIAETKEAQGNLSEAIEEYLKTTYLYSENNTLALKALLRVAQIYEHKNNFKEAVNIYKRIMAMDVQEAKYARERIDWIRDNLK